MEMGMEDNWSMKESMLDQQAGVTKYLPLSDASNGSSLTKMGLDVSYRSYDHRILIQKHAFGFADRERI